jgi:hypothetical protein
MNDGAEPPKAALEMVAGGDLDMLNITFNDQSWAKTLGSDYES